MYRIFLIILALMFVYIEQCNFQRQDVDTITDLQMQITKIRKENKLMNKEILSKGTKWLEDYREAKSIKAYNESIKKQTFESLLNNFFVSNNLGPINDIFLKLAIKEGIEGIEKDLFIGRSFIPESEAKKTFFDKMKTIENILDFGEEKQVSSILNNFFQTQKSIGTVYSNNATGKDKKIFENIQEELFKIPLSGLDVSQDDKDVMANVANDINSLKDLIISVSKAILKTNKNIKNQKEGISKNITHEELDQRVLQIMKEKGVFLEFNNGVIGFKGDTSFIKEFLTEKGI